MSPDDNGRHVVGEYAQYEGRRIKIGTCESLYYLRADQAHLITGYDLDSEHARRELRYRFPFPDEDRIEPGAFGDFDRSLPVIGVEAPEGVSHYDFSGPCPELPASGRTGPRGGAVELVQQRWWDGRLVSVCRCRGCHAVYRMPALSDAQPVIDALHAMADAVLERENADERRAVRLRTTADRVLAGYEVRALAAV